MSTSGSVWRCDGRHRSAMVSWLLDASPPETLDLARSQVPTPIRAAHRLWFRRRYERRFGSTQVQPLAA